jgi:undecaprenyl-diphosphatase
MVTVYHIAEESRGILTGMDSVSAILLGLIQGITEFLPVSSSGHLVFMHSLFGESTKTDLAFDAVLQLSTVLAVIVYFFEELYTMLQTVMRKLGRLPVNEGDMVLVKALTLGTIPALVFGFFLESFMETAFRQPLLVAFVLVLGSLFFMFAEYRYDNCFHDRELTPKMGWKIGLFQALALIPGFSRSGAALAGGMLLGLSREQAARFSFLLAVPIILISGLKKLLEFMSMEGEAPWAGIVFGSVVAFAVGLSAIHFMIGFVKRHTLWPFIWYRIILASFIIFLFVFNS